ncbi:MAG: peptidoglycan DD-metalloendopeptidase family protein [Nitrosomonadales bacterium]|nr:peptidoglycan DD-metalloendopeptidase family protein [Nitrosomonadales bacterium]
MMKHRWNMPCIALAAVLLAGCASSEYSAPVSERGAVEKKSAIPIATENNKLAQHEEVDWRPQVYVVQKGDTLYGIAFNHGLDYREIASLNNLQNPDVIHVGQELRLFASGSVVAARPGPEVKVEALKPGEIKTVAEVKPAEILLKSQPIALKLPYSEQAVAQIEKLQGAPHKAEMVAPAKMEPKPVEIKAEAVAVPVVSAPAGNDEAVDWGLPSNGKVLADFSEKDNRKGVDLAGKMGQPVLASAAGKVVYSGSGLRGYGKLVIIKHNSTYLSAYAHNDKILVKEGDAVSKGQKIAEMGNSDADQIKLHFEIRKFGKPVDPAKYLSFNKS